MLSCENVVRDFGGLRALDRVSMSVAEGEILGLVGPNGSGKSTLINAITGLYPPNSGQITFKGEEISRWEPHQITRHGISRTYQIPRPFMSMSALENVSISYMFGHHYEGREHAEREALRWLEFTGLAELAQAPASKLNLHQRKFLELARALAAQPTLLLLDEVLAGLNPREIEESLAMVKKIHERGVTILIVEHIMHVVVQLSHRIVVLDQGQVIADGVPEEVMRNQTVISVYLGEDYAESH
jgi:ABC-type branched-subunit amino acid transport system ATPase component